MTERRTTFRRTWRPCPGSPADTLRRIREGCEDRMRQGEAMHGVFDHRPDPPGDPRWMLGEAWPEGLDYINYCEMTRAQVALRIPDPDRHARAQALLLELADRARLLLIRHAEVDEEIRKLLQAEGGRREA